MTYKEWPLVSGARPGYYPRLPMTSKKAELWANTIAKALARGNGGTSFLTRAEREALMDLRRRLIEEAGLITVPVDPS